MKYQFQYGNGVLCLPDAVLSRLARADELSVKVLLCLAGGITTRNKIAAQLACSASAVDRALSFWQSEGIITKQATEAVIPTSEQAAETEVVEATAPARPTAATALPRYSTEEMSELLERRAGLRALLDECSRAFGKVFSSHEINILLGLLDYLNVDGEYLLLLLTHCAKIGKRSVRYVESCAVSYFDEGVTDAATLQLRLKAQEERHEAENKIRTLFGMKDRALTSKESKMIDAWLFTYHYGMDIITHAYELTVNATGNPSVPYTNSIIERWGAAGYKTLAEIDAAEQERKTQATPAGAGNSFDTDDFFDAALKRSFGEDYRPADTKRRS